MIFKLIFIGCIVITTTLNAKSIYINTNELKLSDLVKITSKALNKTILMPEVMDSYVYMVNDGALNKEQLLDILRYSLEQKGYKIVEFKNSLKIIKDQHKDEKDEIVQDIPKKIEPEKLDTKTQTNQDIKIFEKLKTKTIHLNYSKASHIQKVLKPLENKNKTSKNIYKQKWKILSDDRTNSITIVGDKDFIKIVSKIVKSIDINQYQVYIKTKIIEISHTKAHNIGVKYGLIGGKSDNYGLRSFAANLGGESLLFNTDEIGMNKHEFDSGFLLGATINLLNSHGALEVISQPSLLCINNKKSSIYIGQTKSIKTDTTLTDNNKVVMSSLNRENIGLSLSVSPQVLSDKKVVLDINISVENLISTTTNGQPDTTKKHIQTTAIVDTSQTVVLGGLIGTRDETIQNKVPFWSDIPLLGELFKNEEKRKEKISLAIVVTPYIVPKGKNIGYITDKINKIEHIEQKLTQQIRERLKKQIKSENNSKSSQ